MDGLISIGAAPWNSEDILSELEEFSYVYASRPIKDNQGGMKAPHMFATWFMVRRLDPEVIIESGVWRGQGTWLLEKACPKARIISIDIALSTREYISEKVTYSDIDFKFHDWSDLPEKTLCFFDDHQNAYERLLQCKWFGIKHVIFEDNYPASQGDCYSLKKVFAHAGFQSAQPSPVQSTEKECCGGFLSRFIKRPALARKPSCETLGEHIPPNDRDARMLHYNLEIYYEFPPIFKTDITRWGDKWDGSYPTPAPLRTGEPKSSERIYLDEAMFYTWICYAKLK